MESGELPKDACLRCWNGGRKIPKYRCLQHRDEEPVHWVGPTVVAPEVRVEILQPEIIVPSTGICDPKTGKRMNQKAVAGMMSKPRYQGTCFAEVMVARREEREEEEERRQPKCVLPCPNGEEVPLTHVEVISMIFDIMEKTGHPIPDGEKTHLAVHNIQATLTSLLQNHRKRRPKKPVTPELVYAKPDLISWEDDPIQLWEDEVQWEVTPINPVALWEDLQGLNLGPEKEVTGNTVEKRAEPMGKQRRCLWLLKGSAW